MDFLQTQDPRFFNRYAYTFNDPVNLTDPNGECPVCVPIAIFIIKEIAAEGASQATGGATDFLSVRRTGTKAAKFVGSEGVKLSLKAKDGWDAKQKAEAVAKVQKLDSLAKQGDLAKTVPQRSSTSAGRRYKKAGGDVPSGNDVDHVQDLQLGGADDLANMAPLDSSVNRSLGSQINHQIKDLPAGTKVCSVEISGC